MGFIIFDVIKAGYFRAGGGLPLDSHRFTLLVTERTEGSELLGKREREQLPLLREHLRDGRSTGLEDGWILLDRENLGEGWRMFWTTNHLHESWRLLLPPPPRKVTCPPNKNDVKRKFRLPTIDFQGQAVSFRGSHLYILISYIPDKQFLYKVGPLPVINMGPKTSKNREIGPYK